MELSKSIACVILMLSQLSNGGMCDAASIFQDEIFFEFYNRSNIKTYTSNSLDENLASHTGCKPSNKITMIVHGWNEDCSAVWAQDIIKNFNVVRRGCIVCMNYGKFSLSDYNTLVSQFSGIADVLTNKLRQFVRSKFSASKMFMFGFSFGGQLVLEAGRNFGIKLIPRIDACEPAGPGFDNNVTIAKLSSMDSAKFVQCIHTSNDKGTLLRKCHQDWNMGNCGLNQVAAGPPPLGSHGLCPYFYNSAFNNKFYAIPKPSQCAADDRLPLLIRSGLAMGYEQPIISTLHRFIGFDYYANTYKSPPYNKPDK